MTKQVQLKKTLSVFLLSTAGIGMMISGTYVGWNLGLIESGVWGMLVAILIVTVMYVCFSLCYAELSCSMPKAGGGFFYSRKALGNETGFITGISQVLEYAFALPGVAIGIGFYIHAFIPIIPITWIAIIIYLFFTFINILGIAIAAIIEMLVTLGAILGIVVFAIYAIPHFSILALGKDDINGTQFNEICKAIPFAIWFFSGIEGLANIAEEAKNPQKDLTRAFIIAITVEVILCFIVFFGSIGTEGWKHVVYDDMGTLSDSPLLISLKNIHANNWIIFFVSIMGIIALVASFHGLMISMGRVSFEMGRDGYAPRFLKNIHKRYLTPYWALIINTILGIIILLIANLNSVITLSAMAALLLYGISIYSLMVLRRKHPDMHRPFKLPLYPLLAYIGLLFILVCFIVIAIFNPILFTYFILFILVSFIFYKFFFKYFFKTL